MSMLNTCRVYVVGDRGVGKTTLIRRFMENNTEVGNKAVSCQLSARTEFSANLIFFPASDVRMRCAVMNSNIFILVDNQHGYDGWTVDDMTLLVEHDDSITSLVSHVKYCPMHRRRASSPGRPTPTPPARPGRWRWRGGGWGSWSRRPALQTRY